MHCVIREYKMVRANASEMAEASRKEFVPIVEAIPGFVSYSVFATEDGELIAVSIFSGEAGAQKSIDSAAAWVRTSEAGTWVSGPPRVIMGTVVVRETSERTDETGFELLRRFKTAPSDMNALGNSIRTGLIPILKSNNEFLSYAFVDSHDEHVMSLTAFASEAGVRDSHARSMQWIKANVSDIVQGEPEVKIGKILLRRHTPHAVTVA